MKLKHTRVIDWCNHCPPPKSHGQYPISAHVICDFCGKEARCHKHKDIGMTVFKAWTPDSDYESISICTDCHLKDVRSKEPLYPKLLEKLNAIERSRSLEAAYIKDSRNFQREYTEAFYHLRKKLKPYRKG